MFITGCSQAPTLCIGIADRYYARAKKSTFYHCYVFEGCEKKMNFICLHVVRAALRLFAPTWAGSRPESIFSKKLLGYRRSKTYRIRVIKWTGEYFCICDPSCQAKLLVALHTLEKPTGNSWGWIKEARQRGDQGKGRLGSCSAS